ncbi:MAG: hypothetical protein M0D57_09630 [Sphingobacteriales bacterium JAD_PAG50586_3]|nr:MAG: hypothetical protein M0D57_09630 [Sphingobacteriales bacterium JAD_PAG50586_3]
MKNALLILFLMACWGLNAQTVGVGLPETGKEGEYGEWQKVTDKLPDGTDVTFEYRLQPYQEKCLCLQLRCGDKKHISL